MDSGNEYVQFFNNLYKFAPKSLEPLFLLGLFRLAPIVALSPFLGAKLPAMLKAGTLVVLALVFFPHLAMTAQTVITYDLTFLFCCLKEFLIGFIIVFFLSVPFYFVQAGGALIDFQRGASSLQVADPFSQAQTSPLGNLYNYVLIAAFFAIGGFTHFLEMMFTSYSLIPIDTLLNPLFFDGSQPFWGMAIAIATKVLAVGIQLAAPALMAILMTEVFLGIANRLAPQVQIVFLGMSVKSLLGLTLLCAGWAYILSQMDKQTLLWMQDIDKMITYIPSNKA